MDAQSADSLAHLSQDDVHGSGVAIEDLDLPVIARWHDVHDAAAKIAGVKELEQIVQLQAGGLSQEEVGAELGISQPTVSRRYKATMTELLAELGGVVTPATPRNPVGTRRDLAAA